MPKRTDIPDWERADFERDGFVLAENIFAAAELEKIREAVDRLHRRALSGLEPALAEACVFESDQPDEKRGGRALERDENAVFILGDPTRFDPSLLDLLLVPGMTRLVEMLLGAEDILLHFANITTKAPKIGSAINWHRDFPNRYICPVAPKMVRTMICLDGMSPENGGTKFVAGSADSGESGGAIAETDPRILAPVCAPGAVVAIHPLALHGGGPNLSPLARRNIIIQWGIAGMPFQTDATESLTGRRPSDFVPAK